VFGQKLGTSFAASFRTGSVKPGFSMESGQWVVESSRPGYVAWTRNLTHVQVEVAALDEASLPRLLSHLNWWDDQTVDLDALKIPVVRQRVDVHGTANRFSQLVLDPYRLLGQKPAPTASGFFYLAVQAPEAHHEWEQTPREVLVNFTDLGVTSKLSAPAGLIWVTRLSTGQPVADAEVVIRDRKAQELWRGTTDADGVAVTPGRAKLLSLAPSVAPEDEVPDSEDDGEDEGESGTSGLLVFVRSGQDLTFVDPLRTGAYASWNFDVSTDYAPQAEALRGFLHTDRGLYRPGDTVHVKGLARTVRLGEPLRVPKERVHVTVFDPRGTRVLETDTSLSRFGGFALDLPVGGDARLGDYSIQARLPQGTFHESFSVEEYRPASFEVKVASLEPRARAGQTLRMKVDGRYFYGAPVRAASLTWRVHARSRVPVFAGLSDYEFHDHRSWNRWSRGGEEYVTESEAKLDDDGLAVFDLPIPDTLEEDKDYLIEAEVTDETHQSISAHLAVPVDRASLYVGVDVESWLGKVGVAQKLRVVSVDPTGRRVSADVTLKVLRRESSCVWEAWGYRGSYRCETKETTVEEKTLPVTAQVPAQTTFTPATGGSYAILVESKDAKGRGALASASLYVWGGGDPGWEASDSATFEVIADKASYRPGDTARLLCKTPLGTATGLLTLEREGVLEHRLFTLEPGKEAIEVPIREGYGPNVYASVQLVKGRSGPGARGLPVLKMGLVNLAVEIKEKKQLTVTVETDREGYRPGDKVTATVTVKDAAGKPVASEVALAAADEGVLSLLGFKTPDPLPVFYAPWGLGVSTASQYDRLLQIPEPNQDRLATGGDSAGRLGTFRSRMLGTAYWNPALQTDARGRARVEFQAPDNLTAFRLMAVAADAGDRFGSGERRFTVAKPLQLHAALPRFLTEGDQAQGGVVVHNETGQAGTVRVEAAAEGVELVGDRSKEVLVPAGGRVPVSFPVRAPREGAAGLYFTARMGTEKDALSVTLPVNAPTPQESEVIAEGMQEQVELVVRPPEGTIAETASVTVSVDPDGLAGVEEGLRELIQYPYGCLEQTTSRVIPLVMVEELAKTLALKELDGPALQRFLRVGIAKIGRHQTPQGGFSLWPGGAPETYLTAYALWGLHLAQRAGHPVDEWRIKDGVRYLKEALQNEVSTEGVHNELGELGGRAFSLHVLALLASPDPGAAAKLLERKDGLPRFGQAFLARALAATLGPKDAAVDALVSELEAQAEVQGDRALVKEPGTDRLRYYMSDDVRTTAIVLQTLAELRPQSPLVPKLARGLLAQRHGGSWATTQDDLYSLLALARYAESRASKSTQVTLTLGDKVLLAAELVGPVPRIRRVSVPLTEVLAAKAPLRLKSQGGPVFYAAQLRFRRDVAHQTERFEGLTVRHEYLDPKTGEGMSQFHVGDVVRVRVTFVAPENRHHLAVVDRLPAAFEPVNTRLRTVSSARPQGDDEDYDYEGGWSNSYQELYDDRVEYFQEYTWDGVHTLEYLARVSTAGHFGVPALTGEEMYDPKTMARTSFTSIEVLARP
jgi:uncharacterized protein YfaS (alpha-2-macroglobulin family)